MVLKVQVLKSSEENNVLSSKSLDPKCEVRKSSELNRHNSLILGRIIYIWEDGHFSYLGPGFCWDSMDEIVKQIKELIKNC